MTRLQLIEKNKLEPIPKYILTKCENMLILQLWNRFQNNGIKKQNQNGGEDMDYAKIASQVIENVGGKDNIKSAAHCATRLRLQLKNNDLRNEEAISDIEGVKGVFLTQSQFQIIFGSGLVNLVFAEVQKLIGEISESEVQGEEETEKKAIFFSVL